MLDPEIVEALVAPARADGELDEREEQLLQWIAEGRPVKAIAVAWSTTPEAANDAIEDLFLKLAKEASAGREGALRRLRLLQKAIVDREEQGETLQPAAPGRPRREAAPRRPRDRRDRAARRHRADVRRPRLLRHRRARRPDRARRQLNAHRAEMNDAILDEGGTVMQYVGDAVMAVFGAPFPQDDHADRALAGRVRDARAPGRGQRAVARRRAARVRARHRPVDRARSRPRCSVPTSGSSTRSSATR